MAKPSCSVVIPVYNGEATIAALVDELCRTLADEEQLQIVLVNDDSPYDESRRICRDLAAARPKTVVFIDLARNFGEHNAVMAGLNYASGEYVVIMDDDGQNPPAEVPTLLTAAREGRYDVVYGRYKQKCHGFIRNAGSWFNGKVADWLLDKPPGLYLSSFKCLSAFVVGHIITYRGPHPYIDGLALRSTSRVTEIAVDHVQRHYGRSGYTLRKLVRLWLNMLLNFSVRPLRASAYLGLVFAVIGLVMSVATVIEKVLYPGIRVGWASLMCAVTLFSGIQLLLLGLLGEYIGALFLANNGTPQYIVREVCNGHKGDGDRDGDQGGDDSDGDGESDGG